ncbi:MAG TPA: carboxymuconolactone decarboxylase family protein [Candidatus Methanoperedenaceae archaeon]|nr:carboxymuconolactone decarboxylase family protein [Candidatus Methanoperedenaceae archaeon]
MLDKIKKALEREPDEAADELLHEVERVTGEVPYILNFMRRTPDLLVARVLYENAVMREFKRLDPRTVELISVAVASALRCSHCTRMHIRVARRLGVSEEEIFDAILIASSLSNASVLAEATRSLEADGTQPCTVCDTTPPPEKKGRENGK